MPLTNHAPSSYSKRARSVRAAASLAIALALAGRPHAVLAGGGPQNVLLIVDPTQPDALNIANAYQAARGIPEANVLYMAPGAADYPAFARAQLPALWSTLAQRGLGDHIDYIVLAPGSPFYLPAVGLVDGLPCPPSLTRISITTAYGLAGEAEAILGKGLTVFEDNRYYAETDAPVAFDSHTRWISGTAVTAQTPPDLADLSRRYFIGFQLGYSGERGNTPAETAAMIARSVAADGTRPRGTFYLMRTTDIRSTPREPHFAETLASLAGLGGHGEVIDGIVPEGRQDVLGLMTGYADPVVRAGNFTLLPGAFADHLTSFAATFDVGSQVKMSEWIAKGASGTMGTVEEPCVFDSGITGKFPHPRLFVWYYQGLSLGEALLRSSQWEPFHGLFYGDPLTRPFAVIPQVRVPDAPSGPVTGTITLSPQAATARPGGGIGAFDLWVDGVHPVTNGIDSSTVPAGGRMVLDTRLLADGAHELRVTAVDDSPAKVQGEWRGKLLVRNSPEHWVAVTTTQTSGDLAALLPITVTAGPAGLQEIQLLQNGRVLAAVHAAPWFLALAARQLGAGRSVLRAAARYADGRWAVSEAMEINSNGVPSVATDAFPTSQPIAALGELSSGSLAPFTDAPPIAFDYTMDLWPDAGALVDLPAVDPDGDWLSYQVLAAPAQGKVVPVGGRYLLQPEGGARGQDQLSFRASDAMSASPVATVTLHYCQAPGISREPVDVTVCAGGTAEFQVAAQGEWPAYQWYRDGRPIPGANGDRLVLADVAPSDAGSYSVAVVGKCGRLLRRVDGSPARLEVLGARAAPCSHAIYIPHVDGGG